MRGIGEYVDKGLEVATASHGSAEAFAAVGVLALGAAAMGALLRVPIDPHEHDDLTYYDYENPFNRRNSDLVGHIHEEWPPIYVPDTRVMLVHSDDADDVVLLLRKNGLGAVADRLERAASDVVAVEPSASWLTSYNPRYAPGARRARNDYD